MASLVDLHESEVSSSLDLAVLLIGIGKLQVLDGSIVEGLLARPLKCLGPGLVAEPVANVVGIAGIDKDRDLLENVGYQAVEGLHPVTLEQEVAVDVEVAALIAVNLHSKGVHNVFLVEVVTDPTESRVAEVVAILALSTDVVHIHSGALVRTNEGIVAVDASGNARPHTTAVVAVLDQRLAARKSIVHAAALGFVKNSRIATLATGHGTVMFILRVTVGQAIANENRLEVDVPVLVG